jgi:5-methylcytosine-specific restriction endonuclease McrA
MPRRKIHNQADNQALSPTRADQLRSARQKGQHTKEQWQALLEQYDHKCLCCGAKHSWRNPVCKEHIVPISKGGSDGIDNLQPLCRKCNSAKGQYTIDFMFLIRLCVWPA